MHVLGVVGAAGTGTTATAVDLTAALRRAGHHAAILDFTGDAAALFDVDTRATLVEALADDASAAEASATVELPHEDVTDALAEYAEGLGRDPTAFRAGVVEVSPGEPEPGELPIVVGGDRDAIDEVDDATLEAVRADLAFAYDFLIADVGTLGPSTARLQDGVLAVTDTRDEPVETAQEGIAACTREGLTVVGAVVNRAGERTNVSELADRLGVTVLAVVPADDRTPAVEPIAFTAPETPATAAYGRLATRVAAWDGPAGLVDGGHGPTVAADGDGPGGTGDRDPDAGATGHGSGDDDSEEHAVGDADADDDGDEGDGGLLGRLSSMFR